MDSINIIKGYNKVDQTHEKQPPIPSQPHKSSTTVTKKRPSTAATVATILFLIVLTGLMLAALIHESTTEPPESSSFSSNSAESIKTVCGVTQYPDSCFTSISSLNSSISSSDNNPNKPDPETIFKLSLRVSIDELANVSSLFKSLNDLHSEAALRDCTSQFEDALGRVKDSLSEMEVGPGEKILTERKVNDIQTWISGAMTDQGTCLDGLEEMGSAALDEVKAKLKKSKEFLSNSLAIIAKIHTLLDKFGLPMH
ncbi:hypothetical protein JRO89_XS13G0171300 [Xanthoceras sorbifolium]|uniref:Pectinesterase inhibitor domain-containing protein n=1 Tax=Xanthoceras sorbifolium TaxID=99658 RepID=A0ABQ8H8S9_9ROSI|nr:hypothetical protein JRO89_XS13G0171300 [Xanthoceras sorbifolium]